MSRAGVVRLVSVALLAAASRLALAYAGPEDISIRNGLKMTYCGTGGFLDDLCLTPGYANVAGHVGFAGSGLGAFSIFVNASWAIPGNACPVVRPVIAPNTIYYVYADDTAAKDLIVSTARASASGGFVGQELSYFDGASNCIHTGPAQKIVFVGSIMTDAVGDVIPFARQGHNVILVPKTNTQNFTNGGIRPGFWRPAAGGAAGQTKVFNFGPLPGTASAILLDVTGWNQDPAADYQFYVLDSFRLAPPAKNGNFWTFYQQAEFYVPKATPAVQYLTWRAVPIRPDANGNVTVWVPTGPTNNGQLDIDVSLRGYVEDVNSPDFQ